MAPKTARKKAADPPADVDLGWWQLAAGDAAPLCRIFGVRHLSPAAAHHLHELLDALRPTAILVEGPSDATEQIPHLAHKDTRPPLALLAYTQARPVRSILYPLASYSPEWVALTWGLRHKADTRFIDLPAAVFLEMHQPKEAAEPSPEEAPAPAARQNPSDHTLAYVDDPYEAIARLSGDPDHETWWERHFEHTHVPEAYVRQIFAFGRGLREHRALPEGDENLVREAFMRRAIREALDAGHEPDRVVVVCGAFHSPALTHALPPMTDKEVKALPRVKTSLTLMPYSYYRLSSQSGYGAGNHAPSYYQRLYDARRAGRREHLGSLYLSTLAQHMRDAGHIRSPAEVIEAVRLAQSLAALNNSHAPTLRDLRDAAITCLGRGEAAVLKPFLGEVEIGAHVGKLPKGVSRTRLQDDFYENVNGLRLDKYQTEKPQELELDLRENRFVKSDEAAFRDRNRSIFLHRLRVMGLEFGRLLPREQAGTAKEKWELKWTPECEIQLVESALRGDTVDMAAAVCLNERLSGCERVDQAATLVREAADCDLADAVETARHHLQALAVSDNSLESLAQAVESLVEVITYGTVRQIDPEPLKPIVQQMFLRAALRIQQACVCDDAAARGISEQEEQARLKRGRGSGSVFGPGEFGVRRAMNVLNRVAVEQEELVDAARWNAELKAIAASDNLNPFLSGYACALLMEKNLMDEEELGREVSRRLSPGVDAELGAGWFEGLVSSNRMALFSKMALWRQLDLYLVSLDDEQFRQALVYLRRAFGDFSQGEIRRVTDNLAEILGEAAGELQSNVDSKLTDEEAQKLQDLLGDLSL